MPYIPHLDAYIHQIVRQQPQPMRLVSGVRIYKETLGNRQGGLMGLLVVLMLCAGIYTLLNPASTGLRLLVGTALVMIGGIVGLTVLYYPWMLISLLRSGTLMIAEVHQVTLVPPEAKAQPAHRTYGVAIGQWVLARNAELQRFDFEVHHPWNGAIRVGSRIQVLVHPRFAKQSYPVKLLDEVPLFQSDG